MTAERARITVYVADDHPLFLAGMLRAVRSRPAFELVGSAGDGEQALREISALRPQIAVLDVRMPGLAGIEVMSAIARAEVPTRVLCLSAEVASAIVYDAIAAGARGYLSKLASEQEVCDAIGAVARGEIVMPAELAPALIEEIHRRASPDRTLLTAREREILRLVADGMAVPAISETLHLSPATVRTHLQHLYEKLEVSGQAVAVARAMRLGLLQ